MAHTIDTNQDEEVIIKTENELAQRILLGSKKSWPDVGTSGEARVSRASSIESWR